MSRYKAYEEYKESGVMWTDLLPQHWKEVRLRWIAQLYAGGTPSKSVEEYWEKGTVPWLNSGEVNQGLVTDVSTYITEEAYKNSSAKWIPKSALVMALAGQGKTKGMVAQLAIDSTCNQSLAAIVPNDLSDSRYLYWWLTFNYQNIRNMAGGDLRDGLNLELIGDIGCPIPSNIEKKTIANFLDHETAKIDILIEKQQQLIKLLKEKRQAVISHAVTKGLNLNAKMRDSGVEWIGKFPQDWQLTRVKFESYVKARVGWHGLKSDDFTEVGPYLVTGSDFRGQFIQWEECYHCDLTRYEQDPYIQLREGDLLITKDGTIGKIALVSSLDGKATLNSGVFVVRPIRKSYTSSYYFWLLHSSVFTAFVDFNKIGSTIVHLYQDTFINFKFALPSFSEQIKIATFLDHETGKIDTLIEKVKNAIELMKERRTALISAAVTGKIDVRNWQSPKESNNNKETIKENAL